MQPGSLDKLCGEPKVQVGGTQSVKYRIHVDWRTRAVPDTEPDRKRHIHPDRTNGCIMSPRCAAGGS
jgi:hypothetical protein